MHAGQLEIIFSFLVLFLESMRIIWFGVCMSPSFFRCFHFFRCLDHFRAFPSSCACCAVARQGPCRAHQGGGHLPWNSSHQSSPYPHSIGRRFLPPWSAAVPVSPGSEPLPRLHPISGRPRSPAAAVFKGLLSRTGQGPPPSTLEGRGTPMLSPF